MRLERAFFFVWILLTLSSCSTQEVLNSRSVQRRIYRHGFHINMLKHVSKKDYHKQDVAADPIRKQDFLVIGPLVEDSTEVKLPIIELITPFDSDWDQKRQSSISAKSNSNKNEGVWLPSEKLTSLEEIEPETPENSSMQYAGLVALLCSILAVLGIMFIPFLGVAFSILTLVFSIKAIKSGYKMSRNLGFIGLALSCLTLFVSIIITLIVTAAIGLFGA